MSAAKKFLATIEALRPKASGQLPNQLVPVWDRRIKPALLGDALNGSFTVPAYLPRITSDGAVLRKADPVWVARTVLGDNANMTSLETRSVSRDSLFLLANIRVEQESEQHRVRVRNLSDGGMMGEGALRVKRGNRVQIELRNIGSIYGSIAWVHDRRFGIAFDEEIDSQEARKPAAGGGASQASDATLSYAHRAPSAPNSNTLRKV